MLGLPKNTELNKQLAKKAIYTKFQMNTAAKERMDADISKIVIINEISDARVSIAAGEEVSSFFVMQVILKRKEFDEQNIIRLSRLIPQNVLLLLEYDGQAKLAVHHIKLMQTDWTVPEELKVELKGLNLDAVWENIIGQIGTITVAEGNTLDQQIAIDEERRKLLKEIDRLEKLARSEKQPKKKFELVSQLNTLQQQLDD